MIEIIIIFFALFCIYVIHLQTKRVENEPLIDLES